MSDYICPCDSVFYLSVRRSIPSYLTALSVLHFPTYPGVPIDLSIYLSNPIPSHSIPSHRIESNLTCATPFEACLLFPGVCTTKLAMWVHDSNFHFVPPWLFAFSTPPPLFPTTLPGGFHGYCFFPLPWQTLAETMQITSPSPFFWNSACSVQLFQSSPMMFLLFDIVLPKAVVSQEHSDCEILRTSKDDACPPCGCQRRENRDDSRYGV